MASIQSLGVGSGLLTSELVEKIVAAERESTDLRLDAKRGELDAKISAFGGIRTTLDALQSAAEALSTSDGFLSNTVTSSNPNALVATAQSSAEPGVHTVEVLSLARAHTLVTGSYEDVDTVVGDGTLDIRFGTTTFAGGSYDSFTENESLAGLSITIDEGNNTLGGIRDAINASGAPITASIVNDGSGYVLALSSSESGVDRSLEITVTEGDTPGLSDLAFNAGASAAGVNLTQTVAADDAAVNVDGILIRRSSNTLDEVIPGVTINALSLNVGAPATLSIAQDFEAIEANLQAFVDTFNDAKALSDELTAFDADSGNASLLIGDATLRGISNQMRRFIGGVVSDLTSSSVRSLGDLGISTNQNAGYFLSFDSGTFREALSNSPKDVVALLADESRASDSRIEVTNFANATAAGSYDVDITRVATQGFTDGETTAGLAGPITVDADNDEFSINLDGGSAISVSLTQGSYADGAALAQEIQNQFNAVSRAGSIIASYDSDAQQLRLTSEKYGSSSQLAIASVDTNTVADFGLTTSDGESTKGNDVAGTINGVEGQGSGQFLSLSLGPAPARAARMEGSTLGEFPLVIDGTNNTFTLKQDETTSASIELTQASYDDPYALAAEIQTQINADANFASDSLSVTVDYDVGENRFVITGSNKGSQAELLLTGMSEDLSNLIGFNQNAQAKGQKAADRADEAAGMQIRVLGGETGSRGTATVVRGVMNQLNRFLDSALGANGALDNKSDLLGDRLAELDEESVSFAKKMDNLQERLRIQFATADALISQLNNTGSFLTQQLANLPGFVSKDG